MSRPATIKSAVGSRTSRLNDVASGCAMGGQKPRQRSPQVESYREIHQPQNCPQTVPRHQRTVYPQTSTEKVTIMRRLREQEQSGYIRQDEPQLLRSHFAVKKQLASSLDTPGCSASGDTIRDRSSHCIKISGADTLCGHTNADGLVAMTFSSSEQDHAFQTFHPNTRLLLMRLASRRRVPCETDAGVSVFRHSPRRPHVISQRSGRAATSYVVTGYCHRDGPRPATRKASNAKGAACSTISEVDNFSRSVVETAPTQHCASEGSPPQVQHQEATATDSTKSKRSRCCVDPQAEHPAETFSSYLSNDGIESLDPEVSKGTILCTLTRVGNVCCDGVREACGLSTPTKHRQSAKLSGHQTSCSIKKGSRWIGVDLSTGKDAAVSDLYARPTRGCTPSQKGATCSSNEAHKVRPSRRSAFAVVLPASEAVEDGITSGASTELAGVSTAAAPPQMSGTEDDMHEHESGTNSEIGSPLAKANRIKEQVGATSQCRERSGSMGMLVAAGRCLRSFRGNGVSFKRVHHATKRPPKHTWSHSEDTTEETDVTASPLDGPESPVIKSDGCFDFWWGGKDLVTCEQIISLLEDCSKMSMYGTDVEKNDPSSSPFHSSHPPSISLREYFLGRIVKYTHMQSSDFVLAVLFISKLLNARQPAPFEGANEITVSHSAEVAPSLPSEASRQPCSSTSPEYGRKATACRVVAREDGIEFNVLTAHRVLLTACLIANKVQYDRGIILKHWAKLGGLERDEAVNLEATFLQIIDWRVKVSVEDFLLTCHRISHRDVTLLLKSSSRPIPPPPLFLCSHFKRMYFRGQNYKRRESTSCARLSPEMHRERRRTQENKKRPQQTHVFDERSIRPMSSPTRGNLSVAHTKQVAPLSLTSATVDVHADSSTALDAGEFSSVPLHSAASPRRQACHSNTEKIDSIAHSRSSSSLNQCSRSAFYKPNGVTERRNNCPLTVVCGDYSARTRPLRQQRETRQDGNHGSFYQRLQHVHAVRSKPESRFTDTATQIKRTVGSSGVSKKEVEPLQGSLSQQRTPAAEVVPSRRHMSFCDDSAGSPCVTSNVTIADIRHSDSHLTSPTGSRQSHRAWSRSVPTLVPSKYERRPSPFSIRQALLLFGSLARVLRACDYKSLHNRSALPLSKLH